MKPTSMFVFACAVAAVSGAVGGAAIDTTPLQRAGVGTPEYLRDTTGFAVAVDDPSAGLVLPDHYPMVTPEGPIDVAELTANGLLSQRRFAWREAELPPLPDYEPAQAYDASWSSASAPYDEAQTATAVQSSDRGLPQTSPAETSAPPPGEASAAPASEGNARLIQVSADVTAG